MHKQSLKELGETIEDYIRALESRGMEWMKDNAATKHDVYACFYVLSATLEIIGSVVDGLD